MNEFKGTKGEWKVKYNEIRTNEHGMMFSIVNSPTIANNVVCCVYSKSNTEKEVIANAKLIACDPEMLELLIKINTHIDEARGVNYMMELMGRKFYTEVEQLIKKATE